MTAIEIVILLVAGLALALHFLPKQANPLIAKAQSDVDSVWDFLLNHFSKVAAVPVVTPVPNVTHTVTFGGAFPAGTVIPAPTAASTVNGVPTPDGISYAAFGQLVAAKQGAATFLDPAADASVLSAVVNASDAWFASLGAYFVQQLVAQTTTGTPVGDRVRAFVVTHPVEVVTAAQEAAAVLAAK